jgi:hypothetical protein
MANETPAASPSAGHVRRRGRPSASPAPATRRGRVAANPVGVLNQMVARLISENRALKRQVAKLERRGAPNDDAAKVQRAIRTLEQRVRRALGRAKGGGGNGRRTRGRKKSGRVTRAPTKRRRAA